METNQIKFNAVGFKAKDGYADFTSEEISVVLSKSNDKHFGSLVKKEFARNVVQTYEATEMQKIPKTAFVNFSKELVTLILAQEKCAGLGIYFCLSPTAELVGQSMVNEDALTPENRVLSAVLVGIDVKGHPLTSLQSQNINNDEDSIIAEIGGHGFSITESGTLPLTGIFFYE